MGLFTKEVSLYDEYYNQNVTRQRTTGLGYAVIGLLSVAGVYGLVSDGNVDILGDNTTNRSSSEAEALATNRYQSVWDQANPADKFTLQYGTSTLVRTDASPGGNGIAGSMSESSDDFQTVFNNACLNSTAYDIDGGRITGDIDGLFVDGTVTGDVPTAAAFAIVDSDNPDLLVVKSGNSDSADLRFTGVLDGEDLSPADAQTERILDTYGCETGVVSHELLPVYEIQENIEDITGV